MTVTFEDLENVTFTDAQLVVISHAIVRSLRRAAGETDPGSLLKAPEWMLEATVEKVTAVQNGASLDPEEEHRRWCESKTKNGYVWGPYRNDDPAQGPLYHPLLVPFETLPLIQRLKDSTPSDVIAELSGRTA
jgi:hypothetical protein